MERSKLQQRNYTLDLKARLGKTQVVTNTTPINQQVRLKISVSIRCKNAPPLSRRPGKMQMVTGTTHTIVALKCQSKQFVICSAVDASCLQAGCLHQLLLHPAIIGLFPELDKDDKK